MKVLLLLVLVALVLAAGGFWARQQATSLPDWYRRAEAAGELEPDLVAAAERARQSLVRRFGRELLDELTADDGVEDESFLDRVKRRGKILLEGLSEGREVRLTAIELEQLVLAQLAEDRQGRDLLAATRAVHAELVGQAVELGIVVAPDRVPRDRIPDGAQRLLGLLAGGSGDEVYAAVRAVPSARDGRLGFGPPMRVRLGDLEVGSELLVKLTGGDALASGFTLRVGRVELRDAAVDGDALVLTISPRL